MRKKLNKKGFTLIEMIIVIVIIAILAGIAVPLVSNYVAEANKGKVIANAKSVYNAAMLVEAMEIIGIDDLFSYYDEESGLYVGRVVSPFVGSNDFEKGEAIDGDKKILIVTRSGAPDGCTFGYNAGTDGEIEGFWYTEGSITVIRNDSNAFVVEGTEDTSGSGS